MFGVMWIPFITLFVGMIGLPDGEYAWSQLPPLARSSLLAVGVLAFLSIAMLVGSPILSGLIHRAVLANGRRATAQIVSISDTKTTINYDPVVHFVLDVHPADGPAFQAETDQLVSRLRIPQLQPGASVAVMYHPETHAVALLDEASPAPPT